jgi:hypothetical protein
MTVLGRSEISNSNKGSKRVGEGETLNRNQLIRNTRGIENKRDYPNSVRTLAVKLHEGVIYLFEFDVFERDSEDRVETERVWKYEFSDAE